ncbi:adenosylhomocysteinase [Demequina zhanjiangensis]|uniref:Adenosylhomocysteinase n=1 Tax=Demequina zhanjiangensis TaxID=3051659 RepID=A0ABT8G5U9_9MICO|nr:adenosylhomocysteinase [Demequina sp. SYSU T00b26]MDN4474109.1 adenosylhomocysteinase [Demequina sp. SYSU T00b26]
MSDPVLEAERLLRRFARDTNLLIAGRPMRVVGDGRVADALRSMLSGMGARLSSTGPADASTASPDEVAFDVASGAITLGGSPLADRGDASGRLDFAAAHMPVTRAIARSLDEADAVRGLRIGVSMTLEPKTANLALMLADAGAKVAVYAHPDETDMDVAQALRDRGVPCDADATLAPEQERGAALAFLNRGFDVLVDDGSHLTRLAHEKGLACEWVGATEETTSGLTPLRRMQESGVLSIPVIAVNDAATKTGFDNRYGTGQSCVLAIADLLDGAGVTLRDQPALVLGYGPVGVGVAAHLRALGVEVRVAEVDPVRALLAAHDGYEVGAADALGSGALVISATGVPATVSPHLLVAAKAVAVAGGVPGEVVLDGLADALEPVATDVERLPSGALLLDRGGCINVTAAEGNPIEIMDLSFATQLAAVAELVTARPGVGVHALSDAAVARVGAAAARARGLSLSPAPPASSPTQGDWRSPRFATTPKEPA